VFKHLAGIEEECRAAQCILVVGYSRAQDRMVAVYGGRERDEPLQVLKPLGSYVGPGHEQNDDLGRAFQTDLGARHFIQSGIGFCFHFMCLSCRLG
jgi:hypothetical protein